MVRGGGGAVVAGGRGVSRGWAGFSGPLPRKSLGRGRGNPSLQNVQNFQHSHRIFQNMLTELYNNCIPKLRRI